ncbi:MAG: septum formation initiator family protein [Actinobacteria bacterium]|nr:septum formation initiator family protein [Actinomycetota bacterium]
MATTKRQDSRGTGRRAARPKTRGKRRLRAERTATLLRWCVVGVLAFVGLLYYRPLANYFETRATLTERQAEVRQLREERERLEVRLARSATDEALSREARRMSFVRPGEQLFIVKGISAWRRSIHSDG